jgi:hypothetical protein
MVVLIHLMLQVVRLPDPSDPDSLAAVQRAADNLAHVGKIVLEDSNALNNDYYGGGATVIWRIPGLKDYGENDSDYDSENDTEYDNSEDIAASILVPIAAQRINPDKICDCERLLHRPLLLRAVLDWGLSCIETVCLGRYDYPPPHVWPALQQLPKLNTLVFWARCGGYKQTESITLQTHWQAVSRISTTALYHAAQHYVIPANRSLRLEFGSWGSGLSCDDAGKEQAIAREELPMI